MITGKHVREELKATADVIDDPKADVNAKLGAIYKLITVVLKVGLSVRTNTKLIMDKTGVKLLPPRQQNKAEDAGVEAEEE